MCLHIYTCSCSQLRGLWFNDLFMYMLYMYNAAETCTHTSMHTHTYTCARKRKQVNVYAYTCTHTMHMHMHMHTKKHVHVCTHIYICIHTQYTTTIPKAIQIQKTNPNHPVLCHTRTVYTYTYISIIVHSCTRMCT